MLKPQPRVTPLNRPFWDGCNDGKLMVQHCAECGKHVFYPRACCPFCQADALSWTQASGQGTVISHTTVRRTHHDGFNEEAPYVFAAVELAEGPCLYAQLPDAPVEGESLIGRAVRAVFVPHGPGQKIAAFQLA
ncbi:MAG TPA: OB-fold domain-containing protein [Burkholderiaceae bacterium]|nr:OB-fold domain-containing protein [Burkholderiaceae bacterium]